MTDTTFNEAAHAANEAARRVAEDTAETFRMLREATERTVQQGAKAQREVFNAWRANADTTLTATFALQNAAIKAGLSVIDTTRAGSRTVLEQWVETVGEAQQRTIEVWQSNMRLADEVLGSTHAHEIPQP